jgi:hypothetical protein
MKEEEKKIELALAYTSADESGPKNPPNSHIHLRNENSTWKKKGKKKKREKKTTVNSLSLFIFLLLFSVRGVLGLSSPLIEGKVMLLLHTHTHTHREEKRRLNFLIYSSRMNVVCLFRSLSLYLFFLSFVRGYISNPGKWN